MKHRSVIAYVIVAAALFSLPQLSHELQSLKGAVGSRLHRELLYTFLSLPAGQPTAAASTAGSAETLLASCATRQSAAKGGKVESNGRVEGRSSRKTVEQSAMIGDPGNDPINNLASVDVKRAADEALATLPELKAEVAMIIPPESGIDPRGLAMLKSSDIARVEADTFRAEVEGMRVAYAAAGRAQGEWQKAAEDTFRRLSTSPRGAYEFRVVRDGKQTKVLKFKCSDCPATAPRLTRLPRQIAVSMPLPAPVALPAPFEALSE